MVSVQAGLSVFIIMRRLTLPILVVLTASPIAAAESPECATLSRRPSIAAGLALTAMDVAVSRAVATSPDAQFRSRNGPGVTVQGEIPLTGRFNFRLEVARAAAAIDRVPFTGDAGGGAGLGRVQVRQVLGGIVRRAHAGRRVCAAAALVGGVQRFSFAGVQASGPMLSAAVGIDAAIARSAAIFVEARMSGTGNGSRPPLAAETVFSGALTSGVRYWFR